MCAGSGRDVLSRSRGNNIGVFQGGALSCIMYMLYANDLSLSVSEDISIVQYADDTQLLVSGKKCDVQHLIASMESALRCLHQWFCTNGMKLNTAKTQMVVLGTPAMLRDLAPVTLNFCGTVIADSRTAKNLGVHIDRHLNFETHIDHVLGRVLASL